jgi:hypothetical protein
MSIPVGLILQGIQFIGQHGKDIAALVDAGKPILQAAEAVAPQALPALKNLAAHLFTNVSAETAVTHLLHGAIAPHRMERTEEETWFARAQGSG